MIEINVNDQILHDTRITDFLNQNKNYSVRSVPADYREPITLDNFAAYMSGNAVVDDRDCKLFELEESAKEGKPNVGSIGLTTSDEERAMLDLDFGGKIYLDDIENRMFYIGPRSDELKEIGGVEFSTVWEIKCS